MLAETRTTTGADLIGRALADEGARYFFNLPGNGIYPLFDPVVGRGIRYVLGLHEASVVSIADGFARASREVPFVNVYMVPGTANALSAIYIAYKDRTPLVVTATEQTRAIVGRDAYASAPDLLGITRQFTKWSFAVPSPERVEEAIHRAFTVAATPPQGPVFLALPFDLFTAQATATANEPTRRSAVPAYGPPPPEVLRRLAELLASAERVLFICGRDVVWCDALREVDRLAQEVGAAVVSEPWSGAMGFPRPHDLGFGEYSRALLERLRPDLIVALGARTFVEAIGAPEPAFPEGTRLAAIGLEPADQGRTYPTDVAGVGDVRLAAIALREALAGRVRPEARAVRLTEIAAAQADVRREREAHLAEHGGDRPMSIARLATELDRAIADDTVLVEHATTSTPKLLEYLRVRDPRAFFATGSSVQGWGTPASIGVQLARPDQRVLAIVGDGGFTFTCQSLWTAGHLGIPVTIVVLNNGGYRSMRAGVQRAAPQAAAAAYDFGFDFQVDVPHAAAAFGVKATRISDPADVRDAVRQALQDNEPEVIEVEISSKPFPWI